MMAIRRLARGGRGPIVLPLFLLVVGGAVADAASQRARRATPTPTATATPVKSGYVRVPAQLRTDEVASSYGVVVSGSDAASKAGAAVLEAGGNAVDAAVAAAFALGVTEPMTSGLGAETFILIREADGRILAIDGSCFVPALAQAAELQKLRDTARRGYIQNYKSIATPGSLAALSYALERYGTKPLAEVLAPAIDLADFGYHLNSTASGELEALSWLLQTQRYAADLFLRDFTEMWEANHLYCASDLATTLRRIAAKGAAEFYRGAIADEIEADMKRNGGYVRKDDLVAVRAVERAPVRTSYRGFEVIAFPFPGGGSSLAEVLNILEQFPQKTLQEETLDRLHLLIEAAHIAWVDVQNPKLPSVVLEHQLADKSWAAQRAKLIRFDRALRPEEISGDAVEPYFSLGTTQVSVADRWGNVVGLSQTIGGFFGATVATPGLGFLYNSNLNSFTFTNPTNPHYLAPGRVPETALTPTIILKNGKPILVIGSAGSDRVIPTMVSVITGIADRGQRPGEAIAAPRAMYGSNWGDPRPFVELAGEITPEKADALELRGFHDIYRLMFPARSIDMSAFGGTNCVYIDPQTGAVVGAADPRRSGYAAAARPR